MRALAAIVLFGPQPVRWVCQECGVDFESAVEREFCGRCVKAREQWRKA